MYTAVGVALMAVIASVIVSVRRGNASGGIVNGIHQRRLAVITAAATLVLLVATYAFGSAEPLAFGGETFTDSLWLRAADMFIVTVAVLLFVIVIVSLCLSPVVKLMDKRAKRKTDDGE